MVREITWHAGTTSFVEIRRRGTQESMILNDPACVEPDIRKFTEANSDIVPFLR